MKSRKTVAVIVAHPDDEILWAGGTLLSHPEWHCFVTCLCRKNDPDRAPRFYEVLNVLHAEGMMGDMDDGPEQTPQEEETVERSVASILPARHFDLVITHSPAGEYTRHLRHEEIGSAVIRLWYAGYISTSELWTFAYEDGGRQYLPRAIPSADLYFSLDDITFRQKYQLINGTYNFAKDSWEARTTPREEAFWRFTQPADSMNRLKKGGEL